MESIDTPPKNGWQQECRDLIVSGKTPETIKPFVYEGREFPGCYLILDSLPNEILKESPTRAFVCKGANGELALAAEFELEHGHIGLQKNDLRNARSYSGIILASATENDREVIRHFIIEDIELWGEKPFVYSVYIPSTVQSYKELLGKIISFGSTSRYLHEFFVTDLEKPEAQTFIEKLKSPGWDLQEDQS